MDYSNFQDWEIEVLAERNGQTTEEWKAEQDALAGKQTVPEATTPPTEPEKNNMAAGESSSADISLESSETDPPAKTETDPPTGTGTVQLPVKKPELSLDELEDRAKNEPYIVLDSGIRVFKDEYESTGYGAFYTQYEYPASFFEYAERKGLEVQYDDPLSEFDNIFGELDEVVVTAKRRKMGKEARYLMGKKRQAKRYLKSIARQNAEHNRHLIVAEYFGLETGESWADEYSGRKERNNLQFWKFPDRIQKDDATYILVPGPPAKDTSNMSDEEYDNYIRSREIDIKSLPAYDPENQNWVEYGPTGFEQYATRKPVYKTMTLGDYLGEKKYNEWMALFKGNGDLPDTDYSIFQIGGSWFNKFDLDLIQDGTTERVLTERKTKAAEDFTRNLGVEKTRELFAYMDPEGTVFGDLVKAEINKRINDEIDYLERGGFDLTKGFDFGGDIMVPLKGNENRIQKYHAEFRGKKGAIEDIGSFDKQFDLAFQVFQNDLANVEANFTLWDEQFRYATYIGNQYRERILDIKNTLDKFVVNGKVVLNSQEEADLYNATVQQYNDLVKEKAFVDYDENYTQLMGIKDALQKELDKLNESAPLFADISIANEAILKSYGFLARADQAMREFFAGGTYALWGELMDGLSYVFAEEGSAFREWGKSVKEGSVDYNKKLSEQRAKNLPMNVTWADVLDEDFNISGGQYFSQAIADQSPSILITLLTMGYGAGAGVLGGTASAINSVRLASNIATGVFFVAEAGGYFSETALMQSEAEENIKELNLQLEELTNNGYDGLINVRPIKEAIEYNDNYLNLSRSQRLISGFGYGAVAGIAERTGNMGFIKNLNKFSRATSYNTLSKYLKPHIAARVSDGLAIPQMVLGAGAINLFEETVTLGTQNLIDVYVGDFDKGMWDGVDIDFALSTFAQSLALAGPSVGTNVYNNMANTFTSSSNIRQMNKYRTQIIDIQTELNSDKLSAERRQDLRNERYRLLNEMDLYNTDILLKLPDMQREDFKTLISIDRDLNAIYNKARKLGQEAEVGTYGKKQLEVLKEQAAELEAKKDEVLGKSDEEILAKYKDAANPAEAVFNHALFRRSVHLASANNKFNLSEIRSQEDLDAFFEANPKIDEKKKAEITEAFEGTKNEETGQLERSTNALEVNGKILVFSQFIEDQIAVLDDLNAKIAAVSPLHEIGHIKVRQAGMLNDANILEKANNIVNELQNELIEKNRIGELSNEDLEIALGRIEEYNKSAKIKLKTGEKIDDDFVKADEAFQLVADLINTGAINKNSFTSLYDFKSFAKRTIRKIFGDLDWTMQLNSSDDMFNFTSSWITKVNEGRQILAPEKEEEETKVKQSIARGDLLQTINDLVPETVQTQADFFDRKVFNPIYNDGNLHPAISNYIRSRSTSAEEANKIIESVADRLVNFNPAATRKSGGTKITFGEFLFSNVNFGKLDARKALFEEGQERAITESTDSEQARQIVSGETTTQTQAEAPTYKNLIGRRLLSPEALDNVRNKVKSTVRVMKTRMDQKVSKNVTVKPYIAEIKKTMGKQADIDLKKEMGGLKDGQLRKWLLKHKAAILENMTTTWLMTAMPNAVQKSVDGVYTSDWKGKKIDRESVSTDNAGRTSGAEMVRRLPKAATRLSDADFLSNFFNEDGSLIRGRKESLAKAMAEEISFDIINEAMQDPNSEIRQALETRQDLLGAELAENIVQQVVVDIERGNVKYSKALVRLSNQTTGLLDKFNKVTNSEGFKAIVRMYADDRDLMSKSLVAYFKENPSELEDLGITLNDARIIGKEINKNFAAQIKETNKIAKETAALSIRAELADHISNLMFNVNEQIFSQDVESIIAKAAGEIPDVAKYGGRVRAMQSLNSINKGRAAVKYLAEKLGNKIFYLKGGLASPARLGGYVHSKDASTFDGLHIKDSEVKESGRSVRFGLFLSSADFDKSLGLDASASPNTSALNTTKGFIQGRKWDKATPEQRKELANAEYKQAEKLKEVLVETIETLKEGYKSGELSAEQVVIVISTIFSDAAMNSLGKASAGLRWFAINKNGDLATMQDMVNEGIAYKPGEQRLLGNKKTPKDPFVLEHTIPNRSMALRSLDLIFNNKGQQELLAELENYNTAIIPQKVDDQVALNGFKDSMPLNHKPGDLPLTTRYKGTGLKFYDAKTGKIVSTGIQYNVSELNNAIEAMEPGVRYSKGVPRAVFMVGGPGAGKTNVGKGLKLGRRGYKVINQDLALEPMKEEAGLPANEQQYNKEQRSMRAKLGAAARKAAEAKMQKYKDNRESMVVDGTGASYNATMKKINALREAGYEVSIVFANTSKEEAVARNKARAERALPDNIVERTWDAVQESAKLYKQEFGDKFYEINTNELKLGQSLPTEFLNKLYEDLDATGIRYSNALSKKFNRIIERRTGVEAVKNFSRIQAQMRGRNKGRFKFFIAPGADDFRGLVHYAFAGKGKQGEADMAWFEEKLMTPYFKGVSAIDAMRQQIKRDFRVVTKQFKQEYKMLKKKIGGGMFTYDHALRVYMWDRQGLEVEGLSKRDKKLLLDAIAKNPELVSLADALLVVARRDEWPDPAAHWEAGGVLSDLNGMTEKIGRKKFLQEFIENAEVIFSEENLNKIEAIYGRRHREAIEDSLYAMKNGTNRPTGSNRQVNAWLNWINGSTGAIMFFNRRSALLQMLSFTNFINWSDNNMVKAAAAFANQKQYWSDWTMIFNSDKLKERRGGLKQDVSESEIAAVAGQSKNSPKAILAYLLKIGFTPTQIADSMAIATGGAMFYRNRVNTYLKQGMDQKAAEEQAFLDFSMKSDEAQQSSDPALVSQQQRSVLGRLILAFANTPMQYTRLMKKAGQDLINGRGRPIENISKIAYYGVIQNFIFSALQSALFAMAFDDDDDEELSEAEVERKAAKDEQKTTRVVNSMLDTILRGSGVYGAVASTMKNAIMEYYKQEEKGFMGDHTYTLLAAAGISPPIQSKFRKIYSAIQTSRFEKDNVEARGWALTADGRLNLGPNWSIFGNVLSGITNVPLDRVVDELKSVSEALDERNKAWQRIALALGWKTWDVGVRNEEADLIKSEAKEARKQEGIRKAKETRRKNTEAKKKREAEEAKAAYEAWEKEFVKNQRKNQEN